MIRYGREASNAELIAICDFRGNVLDGMKKECSEGGIVGAGSVVVKPIPPYSRQWAALQKSSKNRKDKSAAAIGTHWGCHSSLL